MKFINKILFMVAGLLAIGACDTDELHNMNINPTAANEIDPGYILAYTQLQTSGERYENWRAVMIYQSTMIQHFSALPTYWSGDKYLYNASYSASLWDRAYANYVKDLVNLVEITAEDPAMINYNAMARIWKVFAMHRVTDHYGDVPYSEAGKGFIDKNFLPVYDPQQSIYLDMLNELEIASAALTAAEENPGVQDLIYGGDVEKWRKFGYSMMLRLGMRLTKVDPAIAQEYVQKAISGGVMDSNDDICFLQHTNGPEGINNNGLGEVFDYNASTNSYNTDDSGRLSKTFVDWMTSHGDPRLDLLSWVKTGGAPMGMPNGYDATTILEFDPNFDPDGDAEEFAAGDAYSRIQPVFVMRSSPMVFQTYAEVEFLVAEAIERGWASGDPTTHYNAGVKAAMQMYTVYDESLVVTDDQVAAYLAANPYNTANWAQFLGEQYWAATLLNEYEAYANWRRTDYPKLTPVVYPGNESDGQIPRRLRYPTNEASLNGENFQEVISRQGPDEFTTRMWWDVAQ